MICTGVGTFVWGNLPSALGSLWVHDGLRAGDLGSLTSEFEMMLKRHHGVSW